MTARNCGWAWTNAQAADQLRSGAILAIKGLGGFHLACDAANAGAVAELRARKRRFRKPFALMGRDPAVIRRYAELDADAQRVLESAAAPILLLTPGTAAGALAPDLAPGQHSLGFMLPYSHLHHLLLADWERPLVMTSGNAGGEPICHRDDQVVDRLGSLVDAVLTHDRPIHVPCDDSVVRVMKGASVFIRRARGYAPLPVQVPISTPRPSPLMRSITKVAGVVLLKPYFSSRTKVS